MNLSGMIVPLVTPLTSRQEIDQASLEKLLKHQLSSGIDGIFVLGTMGEGNLLTDRQKIQVVETAAGISGNAVPLLGSISDTSAERVRQNVSLLKNQPLAAYVCTLPLYGKTNPQEQLAYFQEIAGFTDKPIFIYNIPSFLNCEVQIDVIKELAKNKNICGIKETTADVLRYQMLAEIKMTRPDFILFTGHPQLIEIALYLGFDGAVLGIANLIPRLCHSVYQSWQLGDASKARQIQRQIIDIASRITAVDTARMIYSSTAITKYLLREMDVLASDRQIKPFGSFEPRNPAAVSELAKWIMQAEILAE